VDQTPLTANAIPAAFPTSNEPQLHMLSMPTCQASARLPFADDVCSQAFTTSVTDPSHGNRNPDSNLHQQPASGPSSSALQTVVAILGHAAGIEGREGHMHIARSGQQCFGVVHNPWELSVRLMASVRWGCRDICR